MEATLCQKQTQSNLAHCSKPFKCRETLAVYHTYTFGIPFISPVKDKCRLGAMQLETHRRLKAGHHMV